MIYRATGHARRGTEYSSVRLCPGIGKCPIHLQIYSMFVLSCRKNKSDGNHFSSLKARTIPPHPGDSSLSAFIAINCTKSCRRMSMPFFRYGRSARQLAQTVACGTPPADALRALVGAAPEPSIGGNPPTWHCDHQFYTPLVAYAYRFPAFYEIRRSHVGPPISSRALPRLTRYA